jgi:large subunit ribosomal protein L27
MAHKKGQGSTRNGRSSNPQYRGIKMYGGQFVPAGGIIVRQLGSRFKAGVNTKLGKDWTLFATAPGVVRFGTGRRIHVDPIAVAAAE